MEANGSVKAIPAGALDDARLDAFHRVRDAELWRERGQFVAEGRLVVRRLIEDGRVRIRSMLLSAAARADLADVLGRVPGDVPVHVCDREVMRRLTGFNFHRGCLAIADRPAPVAVGPLLERARSALVLEELTDADNVGGVFRNAAAFGVDAVILSPGCCDPLYRKATRTSMGATLRVPFARMAEWPAGLDAFRAAGMALVALTPRSPALALDDYAAALPDRLAIMLGTEGAGLSAEVENRAISRIRIPMAPGVDSLNVAVAAGIALSRLTRRDVLR